jgi:tetratricopeptide (TPR) repeat protein
VKNHARAVLQLALAKLYASGGYIDKAIETAEAAARTEPGDIHYKFELAALYLKLEDLDAAERMIAAAESNMSSSGFRSGTLRQLKKALRIARKQQNSPSL